MNDEKIKNKLSQMTEQEIRNSSPVLLYRAYELGFLKSAKYSQEEIQEKKKKYLEMWEVSKFKVHYKRWEYEVEKRFNDVDFYNCPDKYFLLLDRFSEIGAPL